MVLLFCSWTTIREHRKAAATALPSVLKAKGIVAMVEIPPTIGEVARGICTGL